MYLKSLTLRGFKSFASATTLKLEPGITSVVGPNGSGKSNIVDALSWVMGEQGAKSLRGGKMEDVVFAGTTSRPALGRAEVSLTIDNTDGSLPIDYSEVTISRLMFRSGQSEYAINGEHCRLLDVQDLLSDSGLGREMHVIVGQGQLDQILHAGPEARRALIEEAAGVLKHRKRKEKALRKLEAMQVNLTRLVDLTAELNRRLKPLGRQAEIARKAATIQADLRDAKLRLLADDYETLKTRLEREEADEAAIKARRTHLEEDLAEARESEAKLDLQVAEQSAVLARSQQTWFALSSLAERLRMLEGLATERASLLAAEPEPERPARDPDELDRQAAEFRAEEEALSEQMAEARDHLSDAVGERTKAETELAETERRLADDARAAAGRAERLARLRGQADAADSRTAAGQEEIGRLMAAAAAARERAERARQEYSEVQDVADGRDEDRSGLAAEHEQAAANHKKSAERRDVLRKAERKAASEVAAQRARVEALVETLRRGVDGSATVLGDKERFAGVLGSFAESLKVADGYETAISAALGAAADAITVESMDAALTVLRELRASDGGIVSLAIAAAPVPAASPGPSPEGTRWAIELVTAPAELSGVVAELLERVVVIESLRDAESVVKGGMKAVTRDGDLVGARWAHGGSARSRSLLDVRAAADEAETKLGEAEAACEQLAIELDEATEAVDAARRIVDETLSRMQAVDAAAAEISGRLGRLGGAARAARDEADRLDASIGAARRAAEKDLAKLASIRRELADAEADAVAHEEAPQPGDDDAEREAMAQRCTAARNAEMEARLEVRTVEERLRAISGRADSLTAAAAAERTARERAVARRRQRATQASVARAVASGARATATAAETSLAQALERRRVAEEASSGSGEALKSVRVRVTALAAELDKVVNTAHGSEMARAEHRLRLEQFGTAAAEDYGVTPEILIGEYGPSVGVPAPEDTAPAKRGSRSSGASASAPGSAKPAAPTSLADALRAVTDAARAEDEPDSDSDSDSGREPSSTVSPDISEMSGDGGGIGGGDGDGGGAGPVADEAPVATVPYVREEQEKRAAEAERQLARLGKVNPLALEEYAALQERHAFLTTQLEDLRKTRRDLLTVVKEVDDRVQEVFASAYADTAREFEGLFARLFPGGAGRLILTEPDDMLATGIEIEARPPGKKVKRLSLLSGGERSLTAVAYLFAIFKARPSPFYVLDEVEAALDDTNLQRLLGVFEELREISQLIVITHQRRTMEAADALYGVSMRGDGVSHVISQRVREREREPA
jgi:chromosome segregation protein